ncbi:hypothetical protein [Desulfobacula toluolica]|uniref:hypothetical protein n=1 Tax=Desulfobacula toluolica TaxID=28223 RepID=UPI00068694DA|nr:hypothetical protein [Desulfobacula toluolica]
MKNQRGNPGIERLKKIYSLYDDAIDHMEGVCQKKCSSCCTCNVTLTSLEADFLFGALTLLEKKALQDRINRHFPEKRYIPKMTTNSFARLCMEGKEIPEEENDPSWGKCPLLVNDLCSIYEVRPFGCRALMSRVHCSEKGYAQVPPIVLTLNNLFLQAIEHMDENGFSGNLSDMLTQLLPDNTSVNFSDPAKIHDNGRFVFNEKIPVLMIPPEHRENVRPVWEKLYYYFC